MTGDGKGQAVRVFDVVALGPFMVWAACAAKDLPSWARVTLGVGGIGTVLFNAANLARIEARKAGR